MSLQSFEKELVHVYWGAIVNNLRVTNTICKGAYPANIRLLWQGLVSVLQKG